MTIPPLLSVVLAPPPVVRCPICGFQLHGPDYCTGRDCRLSPADQQRLTTVDHMAYHCGCGHEVLP